MQVSSLQIEVSTTGVQKSMNIFYSRESGM